MDQPEHRQPGGQLRLPRRRGRGGSGAGHVRRTRVPSPTRPAAPVADEGSGRPRSAVRNRVRALVSTMTPPTAAPSSWAGTIRTSQAATGAAMRPPISSAATVGNRKPSVPSPMRKPRLAAPADHEFGSVHRADHLARLHPARPAGPGWRPGPNRRRRWRRRTRRRVRAGRGNGPAAVRQPGWPHGREKRTSRYAPSVKQDAGHPGCGGRGRDGTEEGRSGERAHCTRDGYAGDHPPVDVAEPPVGEPCGQRGADLSQVHRCRGGGGCDTRDQQQGSTRSTRRPCRVSRPPAVRRARPPRGSAACARAPPDFSASPIELVDNAARAVSRSSPYRVVGSVRQVQARGSAASWRTRSGR